MLSLLPIILLLLPTTLATNLFISDYAGQVTTLSLTETTGNYSLTHTSLSRACGPNPSWLTLDAAHGILYCLNEGLLTPNGSLSSFRVDPATGTLTLVSNTTTLSGPVSGVIYGDASAGTRAIALAHYSGSGVSTFALEGGGKVRALQRLTFALADGPGPVAQRQEAPHPHQAVLDPTGRYLLVPDLGADVVRVFAWSDESLHLTALEPLSAKAGSGPRHAAFWNPYAVACEGCTTFLFLVGELSASVTSYAVTYKPGGGGLAFEEVFTTTTYGGLLNLPPGTAPAEIHVSPDNSYLTVSNRNDSAFTLPAASGDTRGSDSLATFALQDDGSLVWRQLWPAGGSFPRHYSMNAPGTLVGVGLQNDQEVVVLERDVGSGLIGEPVARVRVGGNVTCVVWGEEKALGVLGG